MMIKTEHLSRRASERNIDDVVLAILLVYGEQLDSRDGLVLRHAVADELRQLALTQNFH